MSVAPGMDKSDGWQSDDVYLPVGAAGVYGEQPGVVACGAKGAFAGGPQTQTAVFQYAFQGTPVLQSVGGGVMVALAGEQTWLSTGDPVVPVRASSILMPQGMRISSIDVQYLDAGVAIKSGVELLAAPAAAPLDGSPASVTQWTTLVDKSFSGLGAAGFSNQTVAGYNIGTLRIFPVEYDAPAHTLVYHSGVSVTVTATADAGASLPASGTEADRQRVADLVDNPQALSGYSVQNLATTADTYEYLLITGSTLAESFQPLLNRKIEKGLTAQLATTEWIYANYAGTENHDGADKIRQFIADSYANHGTRWVLLGGDVEVVPIRGVYASVGSTIDNSLPTDMYYASLDGPWNSDGDSLWGESNDGAGGGDIDLAADVYVGRAPVSNATEAANFVAKTILYETTEHPNPTTAVWLGEQLDDTTQGSYSGIPIRDQCIPDWWNVVERYDTADSAWTGATFRADLNASPNLVNHLGHANETYNARLYNSDVAALTNTFPYFMYSQGCESGALDTRDVSIAEQHVVAAHGAVGVVMNARYGWYMSGATPSASHYYALEFWDAAFNEGRLHFGEANQDSKDDNLFRVGTDGVYRWIHFETNLFGDPETSFQLGGGPPGTNGEIHGSVLVDPSGDGQIEAGLSGLADQTVFLDLDRDGALDRGTLIAASTDVPKDIPDAGSVTSSLTVGGGARIADLNVTLSINHTYDGDLDVSLVSPTGTRVQLFTRVGGSGDNFTGTTLDDEALSLITGGAAPFTGSFRPVEPLSRFDGEDPNGVWTLEVADTMAWDTGSLQSWSLEITSDEPWTTTAADGSYAFTGLTAGDYAVRHVVEPGWRDTYPAGGVHDVQVASDAVVSAVDFLATQDAVPPATDLGAVDYLQIADVPLGGEAAWYRLQTTHQGYFSVGAIPAGTVENLAVTIYDADRLALATSSLWALGQRADWSVQAGKTYYVSLAGASGTAELRIANQVCDTGFGLAAFGSAADDIYNLSVTTNYYLVLNGFDYALARDGAPMSFTFDGAAGNDTAGVLCSSGDDTAVLSPGSMSIVGPDYRVEASGAEVLVVLSGGGNDAAHLYDSAGDDTFFATPQYGELYGAGFYLKGEGFAALHGYGVAGGADVAHLYDSPGNDSFVGRPDYSVLTGPGFYLRAKAFDQVHAYGVGGGWDTASLYGSAGSDALVARSTYSTLSGAAYFLRAKQFDQVRGQAGAGGADTAILYGTSGGETLTAGPRNATLQGSTFRNAAAGFAQITVCSGGGRDTAQLYDSAADDVLVASPTEATMSGAFYSLLARGIGNLSAQSTLGGFDVAHLYDSAGDDTFVSHPTWSTLSDGRYSLRAEYFDQVHGYATSGGNDTAHLYDSAGDDRFVGRSAWSSLSGDGYYTRAKCFDLVFAHGGAGGSDQAFLYDSEGNDRLEAAGSQVRLLYPAAAVEVEGFSWASARSTSGGRDTKSVGALDFTLELSGNWVTA